MLTTVTAGRRGQSAVASYRYRKVAKTEKSLKDQFYSVISFLKRLKYIHSMTLSTLEPVASMLVR